MFVSALGKEEIQCYIGGNYRCLRKCSAQVCGCGNLYVDITTVWSDCVGGCGLLAECVWNVWYLAAPECVGCCGAIYSRQLQEQVSFAATVS